ncbi:MAG: amino acid permease [Candidatus Omnitrophica bacterium]|nr:amino acid permease [Candidatus Omnitrophota bacterium]
MANNSVPDRRVLSVFVLAMLNVAVICTLRGLPMLAKEGLPLVFYYAAAAIVFLIPVSLITAELATGWPPHGPGGVYIWVKEAFGERLGFFAIWLQWIQNVIWFPTVLSFLAATVAYLFDPTLAGNKIYMICVVLAAYWGGTYASFRGIKTSGAISTVGVFCGVFLPGTLIIILAAIWLITGRASEITLSWRGIFPDITNVDKMVLLAGALLIFSGIEVSAVHAADVKDPKRDYPRAIFLSAIIAIVVLILGSLAIAVVVPQKDISLVAGIMEAFVLFLDHFGLKWMVPLMAVFIALGSLGELCSWIIGPSKGLLTTARDGNLPPLLQHVNKNGVPTHILMVQAVIVTVLSFIFLFMPTVSSSYWILSALCVVLYLIMYLLLYVSAIKLRYSKPDVPRAYKIMGGNFGMWVVAGIGILGAMFTFIIGFFPPSQLKTGNIYFYEGFLITGVIVMCLAPLVISHLKNPSWKR